MKPLPPRDESACPDRDTLIRFSLGELPQGVLEDVTAHVLFCPRCCAVLDDLQNDSDEEGLLAAIRSSFRQPSPPEAEAYGRLAEAAGVFGAEAPTLDPAQVEPGTDEKPFVPRTVGPYLLLDRIGRGGMGAVYRAQQQTLNRAVAVKMILSGPYASPQMVARFRTEGKAIARLKHPHVVEIYDFDEHDGQPYYAMELVEGGSLADLLKKGPLPPREAARVVQAVARAIESAHQKDVLHRDLKPANVLLTPDGMPKVSDFGLAKLLDSDNTPTVSGLGLGTPAYMAPEQAEGRTNALGPATDVYGLGALLYATLTSRPPFPGESVKDVCDQVCKAVPVSPSRHRPEVPTPLAEICLKCLEKEPARRYPSAQALADDLGRWLDGERPRHTPRWPERARKAMRRHAMAVGTALATLFVLAVVAVVAWVRDPERALRRYERELLTGRPVTLIGKTGKPSWFQWRSGKATSEMGEAGDGAFTLHAKGCALLELLPNPGHEHYRLTAKVRHEQGRRPCYVGLYVARQGYPIEGVELDFFIQLTFNDVTTAAPALYIAGADRLQTAPKTVRAQLAPYLYTDENLPPYIDSMTPGRLGPPYEPAGEGRAGWRDLAITVTPDGVTAEWGGHPLQFGRAEIDKAVEKEMGRLRPDYPSFPRFQQLHPRFAARGGLGLYLQRGSASFRDVTVTPLGGDR